MTLNRSKMSFVIPEIIKSAIKALALANPTKEICGYAILDSGLVMPCDNVATDKAKAFRIDSETHLEMIEAYSDAIIYHSHVTDSVPAILSEADILASKALNIPYLVYHVDFDEWDYYDPSSLDSYPLLPNPHPIDSVEFYLGKRWSWERFDCYTLFRNFYRGVLGIQLKDFSRKGGEESIASPDWNQYVDNYQSQGFRKLEPNAPLQNYDVLLMCLVGNQIHHAAIVVDAQKKLAIQMLGEGRLSEMFKVTDSHLTRTRLVIRHRNYI